MITPEEQKALIQEMLASAPQSWLIVGAAIITHSVFSQPYCVTDYWGGFSKADNNNILREYKYAPIIFEIPGVSTDIATEIKFTVNDLNKDGTSLGMNVAIKDLVDTIPVDSEEFPKVTLLSYISYPDGTFSEYTEGPYELEITDITYSELGCSFTAKAGDAIFSSCGELYTAERFPMLKQYL